MYGQSFSVLCNVVRIRCYSSASKKLLECLATMSKQNSDRIAEAQRQRIKIQKKADAGCSTVYLQVIGSGAKGTPNTLYIFTDRRRYLFNCGEGTQRLAHEHKVRLSMLDNIFITKKTWQNLGGLPGLSLTLQDAGVPNITLHGPNGLDEFFTATARFARINDMNVTMAKCSLGEDFDDNVMTVKYVLMHANNAPSKDPTHVAKKLKMEETDNDFEEFMNDQTDYYNPNLARNRKKDPNRIAPTTEKTELDNGSEKNNSVKELNNTLNSDCSMAYICKFRKLPGTLDLAKCVERGVKAGPVLGQLKNGEDVVLPDGTTVYSKDVKTPDYPGPVFIVMEVPEISYLKESDFENHFDNGTNSSENIPDLIVHYTPPHVIEEPRYQSFMRLFGPSCRHLVLNERNSCLGLEAVHRTQHKLNMLDSRVFPLLKDCSVPVVWNDEFQVPSEPLQLRAYEDLKEKFQNILDHEDKCKHREKETADDERDIETIEGRTLSIFHLRPKKGLDRSQEPKLRLQEYFKEVMEVDDCLSSMEDFRTLAKGLRNESSAQKEYPKIVFLGTGSSIPNKTRNVSAILLQIDDNRSMLLDCGEGTYGQLVRFFGPDRVDHIMRSLRAVYISHLHADHHIGLIGIIQARKRALEASPNAELSHPLYLLAPGQMITWLTSYDREFENIRKEFTLIPNQSLVSDALAPSPLTSAILSALGVGGVATCYVAHCPNAFGVCVNINGEDKLTYSGDTIPCDKLVQLGEDSTILIHEATMEDELADEARIKMHSTTSQAIAIGQKMRAKHMILTHFSQRYAKLPRLVAGQEAGIAFDNMQVTMKDLDLLPHMYAPLQVLFAEHCAEMEFRAAKRARRKNRNADLSKLMRESLPGLE